MEKAALRNKLQASKTILEMLAAGKQPPAELIQIALRDLDFAERMLDISAEKNLSGFNCPSHGVSLMKKRVVYGLVERDKMRDNVIYAGCCVPEDALDYVFECPEGGEIFRMNGDKLEPVEL